MLAAAPLSLLYFLLFNLIAKVLSINPESSVLKTLHRFSILGLVLSFIYNSCIVLTATSLNVDEILNVFILEHLILTEI